MRILFYFITQYYLHFAAVDCSCKLFDLPKIYVSLRGYCSPGLCLFRLGAFSPKIKQLWTKHPMNGSDYKGSKELKTYSYRFISVETMVVKLL